MLEEFFELEELSEAKNLIDIWFKLDEATFHTDQISMANLRQMFSGRPVSLRGDMEWPSRSADLRIFDCFLRGYLKEKVFKHHPHTLEELKEGIAEEVRWLYPSKCADELLKTSVIVFKSASLLMATILAI